MSRYSVKNVLSHSTEKHRRGTFLCFTKFLVSEKIKDKRGRTEGVSRCSVNFFCLTLPKNFVRETFCISQIFWYRKNLWIRGGMTDGVSQDNLSKFFVSQYRKISCGNLSVFQKISGIEILHG